MSMLILASRSETRKALLAGAGLYFAAVAPPVDERELEMGLLEAGTSPSDLARHLAITKAGKVAMAQPDDVVIGADQVLAFNGVLFHKPQTHAEAAAQLDRLRGRTHALHSGIALAVRGEVIWSVVETAQLIMRDFSAAERDAVLALEGEAVLGSVGAYRLEGPSVRLFETIEGDYFTILGLPLLPLLAALRRYAPWTLDPA